MTTLVTDIDISGYSPAYFAPADGQQGDPLGGPALFAPVHRQRTRKVATAGVDPHSYLNRSILWTCFDVPGVQPTTLTQLDQHAAQAVVIDAPDEKHTNALPSSALPSWEKLLEMAGNRSVVVDVRAAVAMAQAGGEALTLQRVVGSRDGAVTVFGQRRENSVYPHAPRVDVVANPPVPTGFAQGDRFHLYGPSEEDGRDIAESEGVVLRALTDNAALKQFAERFDITVWARAVHEEGANRAAPAALLTCATPGGGQVTIMDLRGGPSAGAFQCRDAGRAGAAVIARRQRGGVRPICDGL